MNFMAAVRAWPGLEHVQESDADLILRFLHSTAGWEPGQARWARVAGLTGHGAGVSRALCELAGLNPFEEGPELYEETCPCCGQIDVE